MHRWSRSHLADVALVHNARTHHAQVCGSTAELLADLSEIDLRRLYLPGHASMYLWCVGELGMSEDEAYKRIRVARAGRDFPSLFHAVADGRLNLNAALLLAPHLEVEDAHELIASASRQPRAAIEQVLAQRLASRELASQAPPASAAITGTMDMAQDGETTGQLAARPVAPSDAHDPSHLMVPLAAPAHPARHLAIDEETDALLRQATDLLGHALPSGNAGEVIKRALKALVAQLEKRRFGATDRPRRSRRSSNSRTIPAAVRREVWARDGGQCTYVSPSGQRCSERRFVEFDHQPGIARGGESTADKMRLLCTAHDQHAAEQAYGKGFMQAKRVAARQHKAARKLEAAMAREAEQARKVAERREAARARLAAREREQAVAAATRAQQEEVSPWLQTLGIRADEARRAAAHCIAIPDAPLEERLRFALQRLAPSSARHGVPIAFAPA